MLQKQGSGYDQILLIQRQAKSDGGIAKMSLESKAKGRKIGGKSQNNAAHKDGVWFNAFCDNPNCVEKSEDGNGKLGKSEEGKPTSRHQYRSNGKALDCGRYRIR